jgi:hypothetical protein
MNPMEILKGFMGKGGNPQELVQRAMGNNSNPMINNLLSMAQSGNEKGKAITGIILGALSVFFGFVALCSFISYATYYI